MNCILLLRAYVNSASGLISEGLDYDAFKLAMRIHLDVWTLIECIPITSSQNLSVIKQYNTIQYIPGVKLKLFKKKLKVHLLSHDSPYD